MDEDSLRPCPFCGGYATMKSTKYGFGHKSHYYVVCSECWSMGYLYSTEQNARNAWNKRVNNQDNVVNGE